MPARIPSLSRRILARLVTAEALEPDPWMRDDLRIARLTVLHAARGDAVWCSPQVLASYAVLGLHPEKVWPAIRARHEALGEISQVLPVPKKPVQSVQLWSENTSGARAVNSRAGGNGPPRTSIPSMATASIAALYPNSDAPSSAKKRGFTYDEMLAIIEFSGAPHSVRQGTLSALKARGRWPNENGPATGVVCVSLIGMMFHGGCCRSTARWRARRACRLGFWRELRAANTWTNCPKCSAKRRTGKCDCGYRGDAKNLGEFCRPYMYEIDIEKFRSAPRCRELRQFDARTYAEYKDAARRGDHPNVTEMPRKSPQPDPNPPAPPPATAAPIRQPAAEHAHRNPARIESAPQPKLTKRECAKFQADMAVAMKGQTHTEYGTALDPGDPRYRPKLNWRAAFALVCEHWHRAEETVEEALKAWGYRIEQL